MSGEITWSPATCARRPAEGGLVLTRHFSLLVKPASADCNLRCAYCFYIEKAALYPGTDHHRMSIAVLESLVASYMATDQPVHSFSWQGGEPLLMGARFFRTLVGLQLKHAGRGAVISNGLQTNATLVTVEIAELLAELRFLVGVSIDGPAEIHDRFRTSAAGAQTYERVMRGVATLLARGVSVNALVAVSAANVSRPLEVYRSLCGSGVTFHQYIPIVEFDPGGRFSPRGISGEQWGEFLCAIFDAWLADAETISVRAFDAVLSSFLHGGAGLCTMGTDCCQSLVVEHNGDVYPCDFFVQPELLLGNVRDTGLLEMVDSPLYRSFGRRKAEVSDECTACQYLSLCAGDCPKDRIAPAGGLTARSVLCEGWRRFYAHALPRLGSIARRIQRALSSSWRRT